MKKKRVEGKRARTGRVHGVFLEKEKEEESRGEVNSSFRKSEEMRDEDEIEYSRRWGSK